MDWLGSGARVVSCTTCAAMPAARCTRPWGRPAPSWAPGGEPMQKALALNRTARSSLPLADILAIRNTCPAAEGREADLTAARFLIHHPAAYVAALLPPQLLPASRAGPP